MKKYMTELRCAAITIALIGGYHLFSNEKKEMHKDPSLKIAYLDFSKLTRDYFQKTIESYSNPQANEHEIKLKNLTFAASLVSFAEDKIAQEHYVFVKPEAIALISQDKIEDLGAKFVETYTYTPPKE